MNAPLSPDAMRQILPALWIEATDVPRPHAPRLLVRLLGALAGLLVLLFVLAALVPLGGAVIGGGQVGVETRVKRIAHPTGA
jgi:HlyD family secretion protein